MTGSHEKHTPAPWSIDKYGHVNTPSGERLLVDGVSLPGAFHPLAAEATANTEFIVRAVNAHAQLLEALTYAREIIQLAQVQSGGEAMCRKGPLLKFIDDALALAERVPQGGAK